MQPYPHTYRASAAGEPTGQVAVTAPQLPSIQTMPPPPFGGPEGFWSPEVLLCGALADCFILTFRALARAAGLAWHSLDCRVEGVLERNGRQASFTRFTTVATLSLPPGVDAARARELVERAERDCLIARSLAGAHALEANILENAAA
jgi:organic hydroperoxide reductase OsmC/OhrA